MSLAIVTCFFNFAGFSRPQANLTRFLRQMSKDRVSVFGVEMSFDRNFVTEGPGWLHVPLDRRTQTVWQKEAALNLASHMLPRDITAVAWIDADVWFDNPQWPQDTLKALENHEVVQLFDTCHWTNERGSVEITRSSAGKVRFDQSWISHSGFAWAMRRGLWDKAGGLYPKAVSGGGDTIMTASFQGTEKWATLWDHIGVDHSLYKAWESEFEGISVGYVPGQLYHEWHGSIKNRAYSERRKRFAGLNAREHLEFDRHGLLRWTDRAPCTIVREAAEYFPARREDG